MTMKRVFFAIGFLQLSVACADPVCESVFDCPVGEQCLEDGMCAPVDPEPEPSANPEPEPSVDAGPLDAGFDAGRPTDAGSDAGEFDAGLLDAGGLDAGDDSDAGPLDAGFDAGPLDAGFDAGGPLDAGFDAGPPDAGSPVFLDDVVAHVVDVAAPELTWTQTGAVACTIDGVPAQLDGGTLVAPAATGARNHNVACTGIDGDQATTNVTVWWGDVLNADLVALSSSGTKVVTGLVWLRDDTTNTTFNGLGSIIEVGGDFSFLDNTLLESITVDSLVRIGGALTFQSNGALLSLSFASLQSVGALSVGGIFPSSGNTTLQSIYMNSLVSVGNFFYVFFNPALPSISFAELVTVGGDFAVSNNATLESIAFPSLANVGGDFGITNDSLPCAGVLALRDQTTIAGTVVVTPNAGECL